MLSRPTLEGRFVRLEPLAPSHRGAFLALQSEIDEPVWSYNLTFDTPDLDRWYADNIDLSSKDVIVFAVRRKSDEKIVGTTRYHTIDLRNKSLEIGGTWYVASARGNYINPECKLLLFRHAFDELQLNRVQLKCDARNARSRAAILKLGAKEEGTLRRHSIYRNGFVRDATLFSVIRDEWPAVARGLEERLARFA